MMLKEYSLIYAISIEIALMSVKNKSSGNAGAELKPVPLPRVRLKFLKVVF